MVAADPFSSFFSPDVKSRRDVSTLAERTQTKDTAGVTSNVDINICPRLILIPTQHRPGSFVMQITRVIRVQNVLLAGAYPICRICAFQSLIAKALCQIDYLVN